jgi:prevent-host-death family protein
MQYNVAEAKANLSKLIEQAISGQKVVISNRNRPVVDIIPHKEDKKRKLGLAKGKIKLASDFKEESEEIEKLFYGEKE